MSADWARRRRSAWYYRGQERPPFADEPGPRQRSVWDFPRPPLIEPVGAEVRVAMGDEVIARSEGAVRVLETGGAPSYYVPPQDVELWLLSRGEGASRCEWKGTAMYWDFGEARRIAWSYPEPFPEFASIQDWFSFYPDRLACSVGGERVTPQPGGFYGGWVTADIVGPIKGEPGIDG